MADQRSPLPWRVVTEDVLGGTHEEVVGIAGADGLVIDDPFIPEADAHFVVRCVNSHDDLLAALKEAENALADYIPTIERTGASLNYGHATLRLVRAAIANAETKE